MDYHRKHRTSYDPLASTYLDRPGGSDCASLERKNNELQREVRGDLGLHNDEEET